MTIGIAFAGQEVQLQDGKGSSGGALFYTRRVGDGDTMSLAEQIASQLAAMIVDGTYEPGARVHEMTVSAQFKVSRGPVREALRILEKEGLITILPRRGAVVTNLTVDEVRDIFDIRAVLFGLAARRMADAGNKTHNERLRKDIGTLEEMLKSDDPDQLERYVAAVQELGFLLSDSIGSNRLAAMLFSLFHQTIRYSRLGLATPKRRNQSLGTWKKILYNIENGDANGAEAAARELIENSKHHAMEMLAKSQKG